MARFGIQGLDHVAIGVADEAGLEVRFSDHGLSHSIYFSDPDGHQLELTT